MFIKTFLGEDGELMNAMNALRFQIAKKKYGNILSF